MGEERLKPGVSKKTLRGFLTKKLRAGALDEAVDALVALVDAIEEERWRQLVALKREFKHHFGRRSEKLSDAQLDLAFEAWMHDLARDGEDEGVALARPATELDEAQPRDSSAPRRKKKRHLRPRLPADLPCEEVVVPVPEAEATCSTCEQARDVIGYEESEVLDYVPAQFRLRRIRREKRACRRCRDGVVVAEAPAKAIDKGLPGEGLLAQVLVAKFRDHLPLYRQRQIYKRSGGVDLPRSTLGDWVTAGAELLAPVARRIGERALGAAILQTDDTGLRVLDRDRPQGTKRGILWLYVGDGEWAWFHYTPSRSGQGPQAVLAERRGYLQADGYAGYRPLYERAEEPLLEVGCWAHARRYFVEAFESGDERALVAMGAIARLYRVEAEAAEAGVDARKGLREEQARPVLEELGAWLAEHAARVPPKMPLGAAIAYTRTRWTALTRYLEDGRLEIDNNRVERLIRPVALGRKNYLFAGSDAGAERAATIYTVLATCALHELDPWAYTRDVLAKIAGGWPQRELDALLPDRWAATHPEAVRCPPPA